MGLIKPESSGVQLPDLSNPAAADNIQTGFEAIGEDGSVITGTHVEAEAPTLPALSNPAAAAQILADYDAINANGAKVSGSMPNNGAVILELPAGASTTIAKGYHDGNGKISAQDLSSQTVADATAADIGNGKTAWVNGAKVTGTHTDPTLAEQTPGTATAARILKGYTAWVNGAKVTGTHTCPVGYEYEEVTTAAKTTGTFNYTATSSFTEVAAASAFPVDLPSARGTYGYLIAVQTGQPSVIIPKSSISSLISFDNEPTIEDGTLKLTLSAACWLKKMTVLFVGK